MPPAPSGAPSAAPPQTGAQAAFPVEPAEVSPPAPAVPATRERNAPPPTHDDGLAVTFRADEDVRSMRVTGAGLTPEAGECERGCTLQLAPGTYTLSFTSGTRTSSRVIAIAGPSDVAVSAGSSVQRGMGLALIIGGGTVAVGAGILLYADADLRLQDARSCDVDPSTCYTSPGWILPVGVGGGAIGLGTAVLGIALFMTAQPSVKVSPANTAALSREQTALSRLHFTPDFGANHGGVRLDWSF